MYIYIFFNIRNYYRRKFRSQTSDYGQMEKQRWEESERRRKEVRRSGKRKREKQKIQVREKVGQSRFTAFFRSLRFSDDLWLWRVEK